jgi:hypothetical protein
MATFNWFRSPATPVQASPLEKAKQANPQVEAALNAEQAELEKVQEMSILLEERNRIKSERLVLKTTTVAALNKFESLYASEEDVDKELADKLSKWGF